MKWFQKAREARAARNASRLLVVDPELLALIDQIGTRGGTETVRDLVFRVLTDEAAK